jgi:outer membrane protein assembly factor BamB
MPTFSAFLASLLLVTMTRFSLADWPQFRGPDGNGTAAEASPPIKWSDSENIVWKTPLPGRGASSPIVWDDRIFVTAYTGYGEDIDNLETPGSKSDLRLHVISFDRSTGKLLWDSEIPASAETQDYSKRIADHGYATGTPATDGEAVYAYFGVSGLAAFDLNGKLLWRAETGTKTAGFGSASSPVLHGDLVLVNASIESDTLFAFDRKTGREVWQTGPINRAWTSPCLVTAPDGSTELVLNHLDEVVGYDPLTGDKLWWCAAIDDYIVPVPITHDGIVYCLGGRSNRSLAIRPGGRGDVTGTHKLWQKSIGANVTSPVYFDGHLYWASDKGVQCCLRASDGEEVYRERLPTGSRIYASIIRAGKHFYVTTRDAGIVVLDAVPEYREVATNVIASDETLVNASPAVSGDQLLLRTDRFLYCIGETSSN